VAPIVEDLANQYAGKLKVAKINVDESTDVATRYQITSIPTFILFKNGQVADRALGALPRSEFVKLIDRNL
jgi:thioredoxin 1